MAITNNLKISRTGVYLLSLLALTIVIVPLASAALTLTADKDEYNLGDTLVVSGTATPLSAVAIQVYNPSDSRIGFAQGTTDSTGAYSVDVMVWPAAVSATMPYGTYKISATDAGSDDITETTVDFAEIAATVPTTTTTTATTSTTTVTITSVTTNTVTSSTTATTTSTRTTTKTSTSTLTTTSSTTITRSTTNTVTNTVTAQAVTKVTTAVTTTTATSLVTNTVTAQAVTQTSMVTTQVTSTETVGFSGTVTYVAIAVAVIAIIGAAVLTMKQRGML